MPIERVIHISGTRIFASKNLHNAIRTAMHIIFLQIPLTKIINSSIILPIKRIITIHDSVIVGMFETVAENK